MHTTQNFPPADDSVGAFESVLLRFEAAWESDGEADLAAFVPPSAPTTVVVELALIDMERRFKAGRPAAVEQYVAAFPMLAADPAALAALVESESRFRQKFGPPLETGEYHRRFPSLEPAAAETPAETPQATLPRDGFARRAMAVLDPAAGPDEIGRLGRYRVTRVLGRGGMGVVFEAEDPGLKRVVALKLVRPDYVGDPAAVRGFASLRAEAEAVAAVRHPNVVQVYEVGEHGGQPYLALEYCPGGTLAERFSPDPTAGRITLPPTEAAALMRKIAGGVQAAHEQEIVHRDLKPANVLFDADGEPKVTDFGLAKRGQQVMTRTGAIMGTPAYMAPEQARGDRSLVGPATDVWALGVILYEALSGRRPHEADGAWALMGQIGIRPPAPLRDHARGVPRDLHLICHKCLASDPQARYATAGALADDLGRFLEGKTVVARPASAGVSLARWGRRNPAVAGLLVALAVVLAGASGALAVLWKRADGERLQAERNADEAREQREAAIDNQHRAEASRRQADTSFAFLKNLFQTADPFGFRGPGFTDTSIEPKDFTVKHLLDRGRDQLRATADPVVTARLQHTLGYVYWSIGDFPTATALLTESLARHQAIDGGRHEDYASNLLSLATLKWSQGDFAEAVALNRAALDLCRNLFPPDDVRIADALFYLAWSVVWQMDGSDRNAKEGESYLTEAERIYRAAGKERELMRLFVTRVSLKMSQTFDGAELDRLKREVDQLRDASVKDNFTNVVSSYIASTVLRRARHYPEAKKAHLETLGLTAQFVSFDHPIYIMLLTDYAGLLRQKGDNTEAVVAMIQAYRCYQRSALKGHPRITPMYVTIVGFLTEMREIKWAEEIGREGLANALRNGQKSEAMALAGRLAAMFRELNRPDDATAIEKQLADGLPTK